MSHLPRSTQWCIEYLLLMLCYIPSYSWGRLTHGSSEIFPEKRTLRFICEAASVPTKKHNSSIREAPFHSQTVINQKDQWTMIRGFCREEAEKSVPTVIINLIYRMYRRAPIYMNFEYSEKTLHLHGKERIHPCNYHIKQIDKGYHVLISNKKARIEFYAPSQNLSSYALNCKGIELLNARDLISCHIPHKGLIIGHRQNKYLYSFTYTTHYSPKEAKKYAVRKSILSLGSAPIDNLKRIGKSQILANLFYSRYDQRLIIYKVILDQSKSLLIFKVLKKINYQHLFTFSPPTFQIASSEMSSRYVIFCHRNRNSSYFFYWEGDASKQEDSVITFSKVQKPQKQFLRSPLNLFFCYDKICLFFNNYIYYLQNGTCYDFLDNCSYIRGYIYSNSLDLLITDYLERDWSLTLTIWGNLNRQSTALRKIKRFNLSWFANLHAATIGWFGPFFHMKHWLRSNNELIFTVSDSSKKNGFTINFDNH